MASHCRRHHLDRLSTAGDRTVTLGIYAVILASRHHPGRCDTPSPVDSPIRPDRIYARWSATDAGADDTDTAVYRPALAALWRFA